MMRVRFDGLLTFLTNTKADVERVETAQLGTTVVLEAISSEHLAKELVGYRNWIEDTRHEFWKGGSDLGRASSPATMRSPR